MDLPPFPPLSDALIRALDARFPDTMPVFDGPSMNVDLDIIGKVVLRNTGRRDVVQALVMELEKQRAPKE